MLSPWNDLRKLWVQRLHHSSTDVADGRSLLEMRLHMYHWHFFPDMNRSADYPAFHHDNQRACHDHHLMIWFSVRRFTRKLFKSVRLEDLPISRDWQTKRRGLRPHRHFLRGCWQTQIDPQDPYQTDWRETVWRRKLWRADSACGLVDSFRVRLPLSLSGPSGNYTGNQLGKVRFWPARDESGLELHERQTVSC